MLTRRRFIAASLAAAPAAMAARTSGLDLLAGGWAHGLSASTRRALGFPVPEEGWHGDSSVAAAARTDWRLFADRDERERPRPRPPSAPSPSPPSPTPPSPRSEWTRFGERLGAFRDLRRHFVFEYYPWYQTSPWRHWNEGGRTPPLDLAAFAVPLLGAYDSRDARTLERHAKWIAEAGAGSVNLSWWGPGSVEDRAVPLIMDVMRAYDIRVTFHLEPYSNTRANRFASDVLYLIREYGDKRHWDVFLLLENAQGDARPIFKSFRTILPRTATDCHGRVFPVPDFADDGTWRRQTDTLRAELGADLDPILLADSLDVPRTSASGFDGMAIYDPFYRPSNWPAAAAMFSSARLLFSFNVNPGFDRYPERPPFGDCFSPAPFEPPIDAAGWGADARAAALEASRARVLESLRTTLTLQLDAALVDAANGMFVTYINSFNEWHEGTAFEPAADYSSLSTQDRAIGYHNPDEGGWRLRLLRDTLGELESAAAASRALPLAV